MLYFNWANDSIVREQSYYSDVIDFDAHKMWFKTKINDSTCSMLIFQNEEKLQIGQIRSQIESKNHALIGISIAKEHRKKGYASEMLKISTQYFLDSNKKFTIMAFIKKENLNSKYAFVKAGFEFESEITHENIESFLYIKKIK